VQCFSVHGEKLTPCTAVFSTVPFARLLLILATQPVCTALLEGSFSVAGWLDDARRRRLRPELLRAQAILACNRCLATDAMREIAREFVSGKWNPPEIAAFQLLEFDED
jgi:hypothetical protein